MAEFPDQTDPRWQAFGNSREAKRANSEDALMGDNMRHILSQFNSAAMCIFLEKLTGIEGIIADPHFAGAGQHQIGRGGYLKVHADFNRNDKLNLNRRINLLLYLNKDWDESYGGHLDLWNKDMTHCDAKISPIFNRVAIFSTTSTSWHGHPDPLNCPEGRFRKSLALYYYTNGRPKQERHQMHTTVFTERPGEHFGDEDVAKPGAKDLVKRFIPNAVLDAVRKHRKQVTWCLPGSGGRFFSGPGRGKLWNQETR